LEAVVVAVRRSTGEYSYSIEVLTERHRLINRELIEEGN
jgi:hypothetical protein